MGIISASCNYILGKNWAIKCEYRAAYVDGLIRHVILNQTQNMHLKIL